MVPASVLMSNSIDNTKVLTAYTGNTTGLRIARNNPHTSAPAHPLGKRRAPILPGTNPSNWTQNAPPMATTVPHKYSWTSTLKAKVAAKAGYSANPTTGHPLKPNTPENGIVRVGYPIETTTFATPWSASPKLPGMSEKVPV